MMKSFKAFLVTISVVSASFQMQSMGAATVTASKSYVDMKTKVAVATNADVGVVGYTVGTNTNCVFVSTNYVDSKIGKIKTDSITDGTNTIDAARNVYEEATTTTAWNFTSPIAEISIIEPVRYYAEGSSVENWVIWSGAGWYCFAQYEGADYTSSFSVFMAGEEDADRLENVEDEIYFTRRVAGKMYQVGKLALTNDIPTVTEPDFTTANTQLVATIEATAPAPGNYSAVSNAAMNARSATDLGVRGAPSAPNGWYMVNGVSLYYNDVSEVYTDEDYPYSIIGTVFYVGEASAGVVDLNSEYECRIVYEGNLYTIIGYTNTLAQVSQIPEISATDPTFSNAVLSVGLGIDTNAVAAINALVEQGEELPIGGAVGVGALLVAIAAAVAALKRGKANASDLPYELVTKTPVSGAITLSDRAVNLVSPTVTALQPVWEWSDGLDHGQPAYGVVDDYGEYQEYGWGFSGEGGALSHYDSFGNYYDFLYDSQDATELSFYSYDTDATIVASLVTPYETDVSSLAIPPAVTGRSRDFMVRLAMPEHVTMFFWPSGVDYETEDGQMPDVSEPGVYLLAFTETGAGRFALMCRKVQEVS